MQSALSCNKLICYHCLGVSKEDKTSGMLVATTKYSPETWLSIFNQALNIVSQGSICQCKSHSNRCRAAIHLHRQVQPRGRGVQRDAKISRAQQDRIVSRLQPCCPECNMLQVQLMHLALIHGFLRSFACHYNDEIWQAVGACLGLHAMAFSQNSAGSRVRILLCRFCSQARWQSMQ